MRTVSIGEFSDGSVYLSVYFNKIMKPECTNGIYQLLYKIRGPE